MRPPEFTGGNLPVRAPKLCQPSGFNEAAGIHRRKRRRRDGMTITAEMRRFNEAAGIHRRKLGRLAAGAVHRDRASMRAPEFTGGNLKDSISLFSLTLKLQ